MGWDWMGWDRIRWDGIEWDRMGSNEMRLNRRVGCDAMRLDGMGLRKGDEKRRHSSRGSLACKNTLVPYTSIGDRAFTPRLTILDRPPQKTTR